MGIHDGHRQRVKEEFLQGGLSHFSELRALELLLFYSRAQGDVNPLAHRLIDTFGSLSGVLDASASQLMDVSGVGQNTAILLKLVPAMGGKYLSSRTRADTIIKTTKDMRDLFFPYFFGAKNEMSFLAGLDGKCKVLGVRKLGEGTPNSINLNIRQVAEYALALNATMVVLAHNHISGVATPSEADTLTTTYLQDFLKKMHVNLLDHVIIADDDMVSMRESRLLK